MKEIKLTKGKVALVDDEDYEWLNQRKWHLTKTGYAARGERAINKKIIYIYMHRLILNVQDKTILVDHRDMNGLNNCRNNLRTATHSQNSYNRKSESGASSKYLGVYWNKIYKKWEVRIKSNGVNKYLGRFNNEEDAAVAYDKSAKETRGNFANLNFK